MRNKQRHGLEDYEQVSKGQHGNYENNILMSIFNHEMTIKVQTTGLGTKGHVKI